jgi:hypothetical protein
MEFKVSNSKFQVVAGKPQAANSRQLLANARISLLVE